MASSSTLQPIQDATVCALHTTQFSAPEALYCVGEHFGTQIRRVTGAATVGQVVQYFSGMGAHGVHGGIRLCARNKRAGKIGAGGAVVPQDNRRVGASILALLRYADAHPECFDKHRAIGLALTPDDWAWLTAQWGTSELVRRTPRSARRGGKRPRGAASSPE